MSNINMRQILDVEGNLIRGKEKEPKLTTSQLSKMYETMVMVRLLDDKGVKLQRQGRIGFYVGATGQE
ncbi:MAG TPA: hypothetical protein VJ044_04490, partial [Candidatus Hodarchaeales archaeon]|nr:hypothetical protein [Candidatus Hodarchaeales archaeon]